MAQSMGDATLVSIVRDLLGIVPDQSADCGPSFFGMPQDVLSRSNAVRANTESSVSAEHIERLPRRAGAPRRPPPASLLIPDHDLAHAAPSLVVLGEKVFDAITLDL